MLYPNYAFRIFLQTTVQLKDIARFFFFFEVPNENGQVFTKKNPTSWFGLKNDKFFH